MVFYGHGWARFVSGALAADFAVRLVARPPFCLYDYAVLFSADWTTKNGGVNDQGNRRGLTCY